MNDQRYADCRCRRGRMLFARLQIDEDTTLRVAADADSQTLTCPSKVVFSLQP